MQSSRREFLDDFLDFVGEPNDANSRNTAERLLNRALHTVWMKHPWRQFVMPAPVQLTTVANSRSYVLPPHFGRVLGGRIRNISRSYDLSGVDAGALQTSHPEAGTSLEVAGSPELFTVSGTCGVSVLLAAPETLTVVSDSAADGITGRVTVEGYDVANRWRRQQVTLNGLTPVALPVNVVPWTFGKAIVAGTASATELTSSVGTVTLTGGTSGVLQTLFSYESAVEYQVLTLYPMPSLAGETIAVPFLRAIVRSLFDADPIPNHWQDAVFEEMTIQWRVNTGELSVDTLNVARPKFLDLLAFEQANRFGTRPSTRPFTG